MSDYPSLFAFVEGTLFLFRGIAVRVLTFTNFDFSPYERIILHHLNMYFKPNQSFDVKYLFISC